MAEGARRVDDGSAATLEHGGDLVLHGAEHAPDVQVVGRAIFFFGDLGERTQRLNARVVESHIQATVSCHGEIYRGLHLRFLGEIGLEERGGAAAAFDLVGDGLAFLLSASGQDDLGPGVGEGDGGGFADARGASGDQDDFVFVSARLHDVYDVMLK